MTLSAKERSVRRFVADTARDSSSGGRRSTQECSATQSEKSGPTVGKRAKPTAGRSIKRNERAEPTAGKGSIRKEREEHSLTARHKCALQEMVTTAIDLDKPVSDDHHREPAKRGWPPRGEGHEEETLEADSETKKKVMNNDGYINLRHHQRDSVQKEQVPDHVHR